jgi:hypothetical protein
MRSLSWCAFSLFSGLVIAGASASAQTPAAPTPAAPSPAAQSPAQQAPSDVFDKAPPAIDEALRARVAAFYQAHVDGKFRLADQYVAEDSKDVFFAAEKPRYGSFQISKITYTDNFTQATVITACKTELFFHGQKMPVTMPAVTHWKIDNGDWFWYYVKATEVESPWGTMKPGPAGEGSSVAAMIPTDPVAAARNILAKVVLDHNAVTVDQTKESKQEIHLKNGMLGAIKVLADPTGTPGLTIRPAKAEVGPGEEVAVVIAFNPDDPEVTCRECLMHPGVRPAITVTLTVQPTQQRFPIQITFTQPERAK